MSSVAPIVNQPPAQQPKGLAEPITHKSRGINLVIKVTLITILLIVIVSSITNFLLYNLSYQALKDQIRDKLIMIAANSSVIVDPEKLKLIRTEADESREVYLELQKKLQEIQAASEGKLRYVYTFAKSGASYIYVLDATPVGDDDHSTAGSEFPITDYPVALKGFRYPTAESEPTVEVEFGGMSQSGYAPIKDQAGHVVGVLGVDMDVSVLAQEEAKLRQAIFTAATASLILALLLAFLFSHYLTKPILRLIAGTRKIAEGDFETRVVVRRKDELGQLAQSFNAMTLDLKTSHEALTKSNLELEEKVRQRTAELSQINKEIRDILDHMSQAIFTIDPNLIFHAQHSRYAFEIFGNIVFGGRNLLDIFFGSGADQNRENMAAWLQRIFRAETRWENLEPLQPVSEITYYPNNGQGVAPKYLKLNFRPIADMGAGGAEEVTKVMVIIEDETAQKTLELEMQQKEKDYQDNLNQIVEIIKVDQELFQDYLNECQENLNNFEPKFIQLRDERNNPELIHDLFRIIHTIKGNAKIFKLERIEGAAHQIEAIFDAIRKGERVMTEEMLAETFRKIDHFNGLFNEMLDIYKKISQGPSPDTGRTRNPERQKAESEIIKVKLQELDRLADLMKKADQLMKDKFFTVGAGVPEVHDVLEIQNTFQEAEKQFRAIRKVELNKLFNRFPRLVRDLSAELEKRVNLVIKGGNIEVDKYIYDKIGDPLIHLIRNSVDHGIEKPEERISLGKPAEGTIEFFAEASPDGLTVEIRDDGKGLDLDRIKAKAVLRGILKPETALRMPDEEAYQLVFLPGFSTNEEINHISGRGVGMDVVKTVVEHDLQGEIDVESQKGQGLKIRLTIPLDKES